MQRRLTIALTLTALVSIVLVGFGVLAMAQLGARSSAEDQVRRGLNVVADFLGNSDRSNPQIEALLLGSRRDLGLDFAEPVLIGDDGTVVPLPNRQRRRGPQAPPPLPSIQVGEESAGGAGRRGHRCRLCRPDGVRDPVADHRRPRSPNRPPAGHHRRAAGQCGLPPSRCLVPAVQRGRTGRCAGGGHVARQTADRSDQGDQVDHRGHRRRRSRGPGGGRLATTRWPISVTPSIRWRPTSSGRRPSIGSS